MNRMTRRDDRTLSRRQFLKHSLAAGGALAIPSFIPASALGRGGGSVASRIPDCRVRTAAVASSSDCPRLRRTITHNHHDVRLSYEIRKALRFRMTDGDGGVLVE